jgi:C4-dicarboxylate transporter DctQ subunit
MYKITSAYLKANKYIDKLEKLIAVLFISAIVVIIFYATIARYIFNDPPYWAERVATYLMIWLGFIGFSIASSKMRHIELEFIKAKVSEKMKCIMNVIGFLAGAVILFTFFRLSLEFMNESKNLGDVDFLLQDTPIWIIILILPITFLLSAIRFIFSSFLWVDVFQGKRKESDIVTKQLL